MFLFSKHGIQNEINFSRIYSEFISWCKAKVNNGTFSTYMDGEPVCFSNGVELSYRMYLKDRKDDNHGKTD